MGGGRGDHEQVRLPPMSAAVSLMSTVVLPLISTVVLPLKSTVVLPSMSAAV